MKDIVIKNPLAFSACQLAQSTDACRKNLTGVHIEPDGRVSGTNGHYLVTCPDVVEPFKGKSIILHAKPLSVRQAKRCDSVIMFTGDDEAEIICRDKPVVSRPKPRTIVPAVVIDGSFPDFNSVIPKFTGTEKGVTDIAFNSSYVANIAARLDPCCSTTKLRMKEPLSPIEITFNSPECEGIMMVCMPMRV